MIVKGLTLGDQDGRAVLIAHSSRVFRCRFNMDIFVIHGHIYTINLKVLDRGELIYDITSYTLAG